MPAVYVALMVVVLLLFALGIVLGLSRLIRSEADRIHSRTAGRPRS